jgi:hypothetical protein
MFVGVATVGLSYLLVCLQSQSPVSSRVMTRLAMAAVAFALLAAPLSDLATAMAIARGDRAKVSGAAILGKTLDVWSKPYLIERYRQRQGNAGLYSKYDEAYISNPLLARLVETKFHDNALYFAGTLTSDDSREKLTRISVDFLWSTIPAPLLRLLGVKVDKNDLNFSMGDYLVYLSRGIPLGGRKTGSLFAQGQVVFGGLFPFVYALLCLALFAWMDLLCRRTDQGPAFPVTLGLLGAWHMAHLLAPESLHQVCIAITRGFPQDILAYAFAFLIARMFTGGTAAQSNALAPAAGHAAAT